MENEYTGFGISHCEKTANAADRGVRKGGCDTLRKQLRRHENERATTTTARTNGANADQGGRKRTARAIQQFDDDSSQRGGIHAEFYLHFPERGAREIAKQHDRESRAREANLASAGRKYF